jgi:predicted DCC family thiol-disulfide oxidoreductase YuxK
MGVSEHPIIVFNGLFLFCSANAQFVLGYDHGGHFRLAAMQREIGSELYRRFGADPTNPETPIVVSGGSALRNSAAVFAIWSGLGRLWRALSAFRLMARPLRDGAYRWIARNRYWIFGRRETCWVPTPRQAARTL